MTGARDDDPNARYTEGGITVVALDRKGRGLHRARPERRLGSDRFPHTKPVSHRPPLLGLIALVLVALGAVVAWMVS